MEGKVAVLGDKDFVMPFSALGLDTFATSAEKAETGEIAKKILKGKYALIIVAENVASAAENVFSIAKNMPLPCIVVVPFTTEPSGFATKSLGEALRMATGINILQAN